MAQRDEMVNVLIISTDQQRFDALGAAGNELIATPHLDQLAADGALFTHCYSTSPVCAPSRASLMTGKYPRNHRLWANGVALPPGQSLFTRALAAAGYDCGLVGKMHLAASFGGRTERRYDDGLRVFRWAHDPSQRSSENAYHRWLAAAHPDLYRQALAEGSRLTFGNLPTEAHYSRFIGNETIDFLTSGRERDKPFCFIANFYDPHPSFEAPAEYRDKYRAQDMPSPVGAPDELTTKPAIYSEASRGSHASTRKGFADYSPRELAEIRATYYAMITLVDDEVGRILSCLDEQGLTYNTLVIFTSDHGEMLGDHQLMLKGPMMYECAIRVPLILRWPSHIRPGIRRDELVSMVDISSTIMAATGQPPLPESQGSDLVALCAPEGTWIRDWALAEYRNSGIPYKEPIFTTMLRQRDWKIVVHHRPTAARQEPDGELYDLSSDQDEINNLFHCPDARPHRQTMTEALLEVLVATEDRTPEREANW